LHKIIEKIQKFNHMLPTSHKFCSRGFFKYPSILNRLHDDDASQLIFSQSTNFIRKHTIAIVVFKIVM